MVNGPEVLNKYVGASEENIRKLFEDAEKDYAENGEVKDTFQLSVILSTAIRCNTLRWFVLYSEFNSLRLYVLYSECVSGWVGREHPVVVRGRKEGLCREYRGRTHSNSV